MPHYPPGMSRCAVVREVRPDEVDLAGLLRELEAGPAAERARLRWQVALGDADAALVAFDREQVVGVATVSIEESSPWVGRCVNLSLLHVHLGARHSGVGHALIAAAADYAERHGAEHVVADVPPSMRDANRFFAKLGFAPLVTRRAVNTAALRRRFARNAPGRLALLRARSGRRAIDQAG